MCLDNARKTDNQNSSDKPLSVWKEEKGTKESKIAEGDACEYSISDIRFNFISDSDSNTRYLIMKYYVKSRKKWVQTVFFSFSCVSFKRLTIMNQWTAHFTENEHE